MIERTIRREIVGLQPKRRVPKGVTVHQYIGISWDERTRAFDVRRRFLTEEGQEKPNWKVHFPLLEMNGDMKPGWTRDDCQDWLRSRVPHQTPRSACIHCPFHSDSEWQRLKQMPATWDRIVQIDTGIRAPGAIVNRGLDQKLYLHRDCRPIDQIDFTNENQSGFVFECEGACGL